MRALRWILPVVIVLVLLYPGTVLGFFFLTPHENAHLGSVDTLIVLGCPTNPDGSPAPEQRERVLEGVREFQKGVSRHIIMTGGAAHNRFVEAHAMALLAEANGVPPEAVIEEDRAQNTIQNVWYSEQILAARGWHSAEVISSPYHLPRTALILAHYRQLRWETHAARWPAEYSLERKLALDWREARGSFRLRMFGFPPSKYLPG